MQLGGPEPRGFPKTTRPVARGEAQETDFLYREFKGTQAGLSILPAQRAVDCWRPTACPAQRQRDILRHKRGSGLSGRLRLRLESPNAGGDMRP